jgi:PhoPQ-activated pathogenicity-related protein
MGCHRGVRLLLGVGVLFMTMNAGWAADETALDRYIAKADPAYRWELKGTYPAEDHTTYVIELTSQSWRTAEEVDRPVWKHWLTVVKPKELNAKRSRSAFLVIGGGSHLNEPPMGPPARVKALALGTGTVVAELGMVPNQPLTFKDSPDRAREEDDLIAYSRNRYMDSGDEEWLVRLAMVKSGVRAMDCLQEFLASEAGGKQQVEQFVVSGGSKRGWTTWLVGLVDPRVVAIAPLVIDALNSQAITRHHYEVYGFFSSALNDYVEHKIFPHKIGTPEYGRALAIEDPYQYRHRARLKIPKFMINAAGDEFFLPDNARFYYAELPEEKHLQYVPNTKHNLANSDALESLQAFYELVIDDKPRPQMTWNRSKEEPAKLLVTASPRPKQALLWQATNLEARDFRLDVIGTAWKSTPLEFPAGGTLELPAPKDPAKGFMAYFVELTFDVGASYPLKLTTQVYVTPDLRHFKWEDALKQYPK